MTEYTIVTKMMGVKPHQFEMEIALNSKGDFIGRPATARFLVDECGIDPEKADPEHNVCTIGFCEREQKWYGWSHRARGSFGIGHVVQEGNVEAESGYTEAYLVDHPDPLPLPVGFTCKTLDDCRRCAIAFAASVS